MRPTQLTLFGGPDLTPAPRTPTKPKDPLQEQASDIADQILQRLDQEGLGQEAREQLVLALELRRIRATLQRCHRAGQRWLVLQLMDEFLQDD